MTRYGGLLRGERAASDAQRERSEQERPELLLLLAGAVARLEKKICRRCSSYRIIWLRYQLLVAEFLLSVVAEFLLSSREDGTRSWGNFLVYFSHKCHAKMIV